MTYADLFAGCGGLSFGFHHNPFFKGIVAVDSWTAAKTVYTQNLKNIDFEVVDLHVSNTRETLISQLNDNCDILLGGPPCQGFSTLGKRRDNDQRSTLIDTFLDVVLAIGPHIVVMENVRGITSKKHPSGRTYEDQITRSLSNGKKIKYELKTILINAMDYGLAQSRIRWFLIGVRQDSNHSKELLTKIFSNLKKRKTRKMRTLKDVISDLPNIGPGEGADELVIKRDGSRPIIIYNHKAMKHTHQLIKRFAAVPPGGGLLNVPRHLLTEHLRKMLDGAYGNGGHIKNIYGRMEWDKPSGTIVAGIDKITCGRFVHPDANRLLTPRECARIQSFPDSFIFQGSNVTQYYLIGNAVPPKISNVIAASIKSAANELF